MPELNMRVAKTENMVYVGRRRGTSEAAPPSRTPSLVAPRSRSCRARTSASASVPVRRFPTGRAADATGRWREPLLVSPASSYLHGVVLARCGISRGPPALEAFSSHLSFRIDECSAMSKRQMMQGKEEGEDRRPGGPVAISRSSRKLVAFHPKGRSRSWVSPGKPAENLEQQQFFVSADDAPHSEATQVEGNQQQGLG